MIKARLLKRLRDRQNLCSDTRDTIGSGAVPKVTGGAARAAMTDLAEWLEAQGLSKYAKVFAENDVDLETLPHLSDEDLKEVGLSLGHRRKLIATLRDTPPEADTDEPKTDAERRQRLREAIDPRLKGRMG